MIDKESLIRGLYDLGAIRFGEFTLKSGAVSPVETDMSALIARPALLRRIAHVFQAYAANLAFDRVAALPMSGLPLGLALSLNMDRPLIYTRPASMGGADERYIEGIYKPGETVILIDAVIEQGRGILETIQLLKAVRLQVNDVLVLVDRQMGGVETLASKRCHVHSVLTLGEILDMLHQMRRMSTDQHRFVRAWLEEHTSGKHGA